MRGNMMETLHMASGFSSEASLSGIPRTPPYTPARAKHRLNRSDSPASNAGSIHPFETASPDKKGEIREGTANDIKVEELTEGDVGYHTDLDTVFPDDSEVGSEIDGDDEDDNESTMGEESDHSDSDDDDNDEDDDSNGDMNKDDEDDDNDTDDEEDDDDDDPNSNSMTNSFSRMRCEDGEMQDFENHRQEVRLRKRAESRVYKRSHSQSAKSESGTVDVDALGDHDVSSSSRRLRRRTQGPRVFTEITLDELTRSSPELISAKQTVEDKRPPTADSDDMKMKGRR